MISENDNTRRPDSPTALDAGTSQWKWAPCGMTNITGRKEMLWEATITQAMATIVVFGVVSGTWWAWFWTGEEDGGRVYLAATFDTPGAAATAAVAAAWEQLTKALEAVNNVPPLAAPPRPGDR